MNSGIGNMGQDSLTRKLISSVELQGQEGKRTKGNSASLMGMDLTNNLGNLGQENLMRASGKASDDKGKGGTGKRGSDNLEKMVSMAVASWLNHKVMSPTIQENIMQAGIKNLKEVKVVAVMENLDPNSKADEMGDDRRRTDKDSPGPQEWRW